MIRLIGIFICSVGLFGEGFVVASENYWGISVQNLHNPADYAPMPREINANRFITSAPVYNQGGLGICYAVTASQIFSQVQNRLTQNSEVTSPLMSAFRTSVLGHKSRVFKDASLGRKLYYLSPFGLGSYFTKKLDFITKTIEQKVAGGQFCSAYEDIQKHPICPQGAVEKYLFPEGLASHDPKALGHLLNTMRDLLKIYFDESAFEDGMIMVLARKRGLDSKLPQLRDLIHFAKSRGLYINPVTSQKRQREKVILSFFEDRCRSMQPHGPIKSTSLRCSHFGHYGKNTNDVMIGYLDRHFQEMDPIPLEITYCFNLLMGKKDCNNHSSIIYGRGVVDYERVFLIRNSWGGIPAVARGTGQHPIVRDLSEKSGTAFRGDFWITESALRDLWDKESRIGFASNGFSEVRL